MKKVVFVFFALVLISGISIYKGFGISWDEPIQRAYGKRVYDNVIGDLDNLETSSEKYYGPAFEFTLTIVENIANVQSQRESYEIRHLTTYIFNFIGFIFFYKLALLIFEKEEIALLGTMMLVLSPRIHAHSFYNSKDLVFLSSFIIASYFSLNYVKKQNFKNAILAGFFNALTIDIRVSGVIVPFITTLVLFSNLKFDEKKIKTFIVYATVTTIFTYIMWPILWKNPVEEFINAVDQMANFHETSATVFFGKNITGDKIPWYFVPVWIFITIPITQIFLFVAGMLLVAKNYKSFYILSWFFLPLGMVILLKSVLYDGWRQMFFIYPAFILIGMHALSNKYKAWIYALVLINHLNCALFIYSEHPNHNVYFNQLAGPRDKIARNFARDYWGLVYKQLYEYLVETVPKGDVRVYVDIFPGENNKYMVENSERIIITKGIKDADYFVTNFRGKTNTENFTKIHSEYSGDLEIGAVYSIP
ncbi:glycosyltransferase family 39 protein [Patescibacteria group bacterium]